MGQSTPPSLPLSPCAACRLLPYFPSTDPIRFTAAHRIFGASNIVKLLQDLPVSQRDDAVSSLVYEAASRIQDPVYGSAGVVCKLQKQVGELQAELASVRPSSSVLAHSMRASSPPYARKWLPLHPPQPPLLQAHLGCRRAPSKPPDCSFPAPTAAVGYILMIGTQWDLRGSCLT